MPQPAARLGDPTAHGGVITGPGCPLVLIGGQPAACVGDLHVCPMVTPAVPPIPHVGGPILPPGGITVFDDNGRVGVRTYNAAGEPASRPFHLLVAC